MDNPFATPLKPAGQWYARIRGRVLGPLSLEQLRALRDSGQFRRFHALSNVAAALMRRFYNSMARYRRREHAWFRTDNNVLDGDVEGRSRVLLSQSDVVRNYQPHPIEKKKR